MRPPQLRPGLLLIVLAGGIVNLASSWSQAADFLGPESCKGCHPEAYDAWLNPKPSHADALLRWLVPCPPEWLAAYPVSSLVNSPANDDPACITPL